MKPILQALLMADHVYVDAATKKKIVVGIFHRMTFATKREGLEAPNADGTRQIQVPLSGHLSGSPFCYVSLTEVRGKQPFTLRFVHLDEDRALFQTTFEVECNNPLETIEAVFPLPYLPVKGPGHYALELLWGMEPLGCHRIVAVEGPQRTGEQPPNSGV
ncbi:MAG: hypothetical protein IT425_09180 [Pirellulales bacterium]|nr:hypothetical protein [Pirellulales bacterium]